MQVAPRAPAPLVQGQAQVQVQVQVQRALRLVRVLLRQRAQLYSARMRATKPRPTLSVRACTQIHRPVRRLNKRAKIL